MADGSRNLAPGEPELERLAGVYREHVAFVWRVLRRCGVAEAELDDAVQEVFLVAHRRIGEFEGRASERTWLYAIATRVASTLRRSRGREQARRERAGADMHADSAIDPETELTRAQASRVLDALLDELDDAKRQVFVLAEIEGVRVPEISRILGVNVHTVHSRLRLARERFDAAAQRWRAQEAGRVRRASLSAGQLSRHAGDVRAPRQAAWAALAVRIEHGDAPATAGWEAIELPAASSAPFFVPFAATLAIGGAGIAVAAIAWSPEQPAAPHRIDARVATDDEAATPTQRSPETASARVATVTPAPAVTRADVAGLATTPPPTAQAPTPAHAPEPTPPTADTAAAAPSTTPAADPLAAELALIERARIALRDGDPDAALAALHAHEAAFEHGALATERALTTIKALCRAGRRDDAERLAQPHADGSAARQIFAKDCGASPR